ncbi:hypothetical protein [Kordiimonas marina]|uniref:hypothetical protein n=1 Tax=Kordiimonas marina TaxID=2872312 RepID=UPI001FF42CB1|nr:hypothetical protein [Kordiimonas marina]MCJ9430127.1 hypothetical protein [Kordiimonas marina]
MTKRLPEILEDMRQAFLGRKAGYGWKQGAADAYGATVSEIKDLSGNTLTGTAEKFNAALPYIERAGYRVTEIEVGLGLSPKLTAHLMLEDVISEADQEDLLLETKEKKMVNTILNTLFKASNARTKLKFRRFHFTHLELELSILPTVVLKFRPNGKPDTPETLPAETGPTPLPTE